jgi:hypothetical protein
MEELALVMEAADLRADKSSPYVVVRETKQRVWIFAAHVTVDAIAFVPQVAMALQTPGVVKLRVISTGIGMRLVASGTCEPAASKARTHHEPQRLKANVERIVVVSVRWLQTVAASTEPHLRCCAKFAWIKRNTSSERMLLCSGMTTLALYARDGRLQVLADGC